MYMANLRFLVCCHELFSTPTKTKDLCSFILNSLVDICHWMGEFYHSSNSERGWDMVSLCNYSHCDAMARLDTQWCWVPPYLWQQKHHIWHGTYGHRVTFSYPAVMCYAMHEFLKVRKRVWRGKSFPCFPS